MKKAFFFLLSLLAFSTLYAQDKTQLYGRWRISNNDMDTKILTLTKEELDLEKMANSGNWGRFIEFFANGTYQESASAPCGLDDNRYSYSGKWSYDPITKNIELTEIKANHPRPNIYNQYKVLTSGSLHINSFAKNSMTVKITKAWEKISAKR